MLKSSGPAGYSISFSRHGKRWGWKRRYPQDDGLPNERWGFAKRAEAMADARAANAAEVAHKAAAAKDVPAKSDS